MTTTETIDDRFQRWTATWHELYTRPHTRETETAMETAYTDMISEDSCLTFWWGNCVDGCCPTGELMLLRLEHPTVSADNIARIFPEMIPSTQTHRVVIFTEED